MAVVSVEAQSLWLLVGGEGILSLLCPRMRGSAGGGSHGCGQPGSYIVYLLVSHKTKAIPGTPPHSLEGTRFRKASVKPLIYWPSETLNHSAEQETLRPNKEKPSLSNTRPLSKVYWEGKATKGLELPNPGSFCHAALPGDRILRRRKRASEKKGKGTRFIPMGSSYCSFLWLTVCIFFLKCIFLLPLQPLTPKHTHTPRSFTTHLNNTFS